MATSSVQEAADDAARSTSYRCGAMCFKAGMTKCPYPTVYPGWLAWINGWSDMWRATYEACDEGAGVAGELILLTEYLRKMHKANGPS